jgi:site-specific DNA recombinase
VCELRARAGRPLLVRTIVAGVIDLNTPGGRLAARVGVAVAANESEVKSERTRSKHRQLAEAGLSRGGKRAFGFAEGSNELHPTEAPVLRDIALRALAGAPIAGLSRELNERGIRTPRGNLWNPTSVRDVLRAPRIAGLYAEGGQNTGRPAAWPAIIEPDAWRRLCGVLAARREAQALSGQGRAPQLLSGFLRCASCGARLVASVRRGARVYSCDRASGQVRGCRRNSVLAEPIEAVVVPVVVAYLAGYEAPEGDSGLAEAQAALDACDAAEVELVATTRGMGAAARAMLLGELAEQRATAEAAVEAATQRAALQLDVGAFDGAVSAHWDDLDTAARRELLGRIGLVVDLLPYDAAAYRAEGVTARLGEVTFTR